MAEDRISFGARAGSPGLIALAFVIVFAESAILLDLLVPGEIGLVVAGAVAAELATPLWTVILAAAVLGDTLG